MKAEELRAGAIVCHVKHNRNYMIVSHNTRMDDSVHGWVDAVVYAPEYNNKYECFCRDKQSFLEEFEKV